MIKLPPLINFNDYDSYQEYIDTVYRFFEDDFLKNAVYYLKEKIRCDSKIEDGKICTFWHIATNKFSDKDRAPDMARCARIQWIKPIIEKHRSKNVYVWEKTKKGRRRIYFCLNDWSYLIIVEKRINKLKENPSKYYLVLYTAFPIDEDWYKESLKKEFQDCV